MTVRGFEVRGFVYDLRRRLKLSRRPRVLARITPCGCNPYSSPSLNSEQHADHTDQHADNQQGGGIVLEIVHGELSFAFVG